MSFEIVDNCTNCGSCADECQIKAIKDDGNKYVIDQKLCVQCGACFYVCGVSAIKESF